jgi:hypothetical protein
MSTEISLEVGGVTVDWSQNVRGADHRPNCKQYLQSKMQCMAATAQRIESNGNAQRARRYGEVCRDSRRIDDTKHYNDFPPPAADEIRDLAVAARDVFGSSLSRARFADRLLMFLADVRDMNLVGCRQS